LLLKEMLVRRDSPFPHHRLPSLVSSIVTAVAERILNTVEFQEHKDILLFLSP
jgi:hypothetical protein